MTGCTFRARTLEPWMDQPPAYAIEQIENGRAISKQLRMSKAQMITLAHEMLVLAGMDEEQAEVLSIHPK